MLRFITFAALLALVAGAALQPRKSVVNPLIVGGQDASIQDYPYQLSYRIYGSHACGASIISSTFVLTAAHCPASVSNFPLVMSFVAGSATLNSGGTIHRALLVFANPKYSSDTTDYDVAVIRVLQKFDLTSSNTILKAIQLPATGTDIAAGTPVIVSGWGLTSQGGTDIPNTLQEVTVSVVSRDDCNQEYGAGKITDRMMCAASAGKDACQGDSGGPLVDQTRTLQVGIVSWGKGCAQPDFAGVYTNVSNTNIRQFIKTFANV